jgi:hypothetical protein
MKRAKHIAPSVSIFWREFPTNTSRVLAEQAGYGITDTRSSGRGS